MSPSSVVPNLLLPLNGVPGSPQLALFAKYVYTYIFYNCTIIIIPLHIGPTPLHLPFLWHALVLDVEGWSVNPLLHEYIAIPPGVLLVISTLPLDGADKLEQVTGEPKYMQEGELFLFNDF